MTIVVLRHPANVEREPRIRTQCKRSRGFDISTRRFVSYLYRLYLYGTVLWLRGPNSVGEGGSPVSRSSGRNSGKLKVVLKIRNEKIACLWW